MQGHVVQGQRSPYRVTSPGRDGMVCLLDSLGGSFAKLLTNVWIAPARKKRRQAMKSTELWRELPVHGGAGITIPGEDTQLEA